MKRTFAGWDAVAGHLRDMASDAALELDEGQRASLRVLAERLPDNGVIIADEVGMGKTRIAASVARGVVAAGGRVAILVPPGLGFQWQAELRQVGLDVPDILRSLKGWLDAWGDGESQPWSGRNVLLVSHAFANWRLGSSSRSWRTNVLPAVVGCWLEAETGKWPATLKGKRDVLGDTRVKQAAADICTFLRTLRKRSLSRRVIEDLYAGGNLGRMRIPASYAKKNPVRQKMEQAVGLGLGEFDLLVIDEAHKSRKRDSLLEQLLGNVVLHHPDNARRLAITATPIELDASQWAEMLGRIGVSGSGLQQATSVTAEYVEAVRSVMRTPRDEAAIERMDTAADAFGKVLAPYLIRRDKREAPAVRKFGAASGLGHHAYRRESEITITHRHLTPAWRQTVCATEALSLASRGSGDSNAKRGRLTLGNGHGISSLIDAVRWSDPGKDREQLAHEADCDRDIDRRKRDGQADPAGGENDKQRQRIDYWKHVVRASQPVSDGPALSGHPALAAAVHEIERVAASGEKILVFGRFTRPMEHLVALVNARHLLRALEDGVPMAQEVVGAGEWPALRAAHAQLVEEGVRLAAFDEERIAARLKAQYRKLEEEREKFRVRLVAALRRGLAMQGQGRGSFPARLFEQFQRSQQQSSRALVLVARALAELAVGPLHELDDAEVAGLFLELVDSAGNSESSSDEEDDAGQAAWQVILEGLEDEYSPTQGRHARLMNGATKPGSRKLMQMAFNRRHANPRVLVAQSLVGREGLNLHKSCRTVMLLHPEWNPGVVEQQIGRVDRLKSLWEEMLEEAIAQGKGGDELPRIEFRPVVFQGTYDETNWQVLRRRWEELRAQLHGIIVSERHFGDDAEAAGLAERINRLAPDFSPPRHAATDDSQPDRLSAPPRRNYTSS